jgi:hypothetical protein
MTKRNGTSKAESTSGMALLLTWATTKLIAILLEDMPKVRINRHGWCMNKSVGEWRYKVHPENNKKPMGRAGDKTLVFYTDRWMNSRHWSHIYDPAYCYSWTIFALSTSLYDNQWLQYHKQNSHNGPNHNDNVKRNFSVWNLIFIGEHSTFQLIHLISYWSTLDIQTSGHSTAETMCNTIIRSRLQSHQTCNTSMPY